ncbi:hypothetical protein HMPREF9412_1131 [Paenibacillus sp. HGF5]|nr:hypothetical protein HMPREF9412_1131 [Paenibacillus sp. HGF5]
MLQLSQIMFVLLGKLALTMLLIGILNMISLHFMDFISKL